MKSLFPVSSVVFTICAGSALAAPVYWDGSVADNSWNSAGNWSATLAPDGASGVPGSGDVATFNATGIAASTISLNGNQAVSGLSADVAGVILQGGGTDRTLSLGTDGITVTGTTFTVGSTTSGQAVNVSLQGSQSWLFNNSTAGGGIIVRNSVSLGVSGSHTLTLGGTPSSSNSADSIKGVISDGMGTLNLAMAPISSSNRWEISGNNTYTGLTTVSNGGLTLAHVNALGSTSTGTVIESGGSIFFRQTVGSFAAEALTLNGKGRDDKGALRNVGGSNTWNGAITVASDTRIGSDSGGNLTLSNTADIGRTAGAGTRSLIFVGGGTVTHKGDIVGDMSVTRGQDGVIRMEGDAKSYTGATSISSTGTMVLDTALTGTSEVTVNGTLRGDGGSVVSTSTVTVGSGGAISPGTFVSTPLLGTLSMGTLNFENASTFGLDINSDTLGSDVLNVSSLGLVSGSLLTVDDLGASTLTLGQAILFIKNSGSWNGGLFTVGSTEIQDQSTSFSVGANTFQIDYDYSGGLGNGVALIVVPEPRVAGLAVLALGILATRRRRAGSAA